MSNDSNLQEALRTVEPAARLVSERHLRKVLNYLRDWDHPVPLNTDLPLWVEREHLLAVNVLPAGVLTGNDPRLLLITTPDDRLIEHLATPELLREYWRLLFRAAVERRLAVSKGGDRLSQFGPAVAREIRFVLETDHLLDPAANEAQAYQAFVTTYLELIRFRRGEADDYFPSLPEVDRVEAIGQDLDIDELFHQSRPAGAAEPITTRPHEAEESSDNPRTQAANVTALVAQAEAAERKGNYVRAAILRTRAGADVNSVLEKLVAGLAAVFRWDETTRRQWHEAIAELLPAASVGVWPRAARSLYDLQKIPADAGRDLFKVDLAEAIRTFGRRPVKRPIPHARAVMPLILLRSADRQLARSTAGGAARTRLSELIHREIHKGEVHIRGTLGPVVAGALVESGFAAESRVEMVARDKAVAELLDRICERGYLRIGDLRDAIARNQLKMPDLSGPGEFIAGDALLRTDDRLAYDLDGVYRRGEIYLRWLHRGSSVFFGTPVGRLLFLYLILPFLGAFMTVVFAEEVTHIGGKVYGFASKILAPPPPPPPVTSDQVELDPETGELIWIDTDEAWDVAKTAAGSTAAEHPEFSIPWDEVLVLGIVYLLLFHVPAARRAVVVAVKWVLSSLRLIVWDLPLRVWQSDVMKSARHSRVVRVVHHYLGGTLLVTIVVVVVMAFLGASSVRLLRAGAIAFAVTALLANTRWGWVVQERLAERLSDSMRLVRVNLLVGLLAWILAGFRWLANWFEQQLYSVDEWLRFRGGDSQGSLVTKAAVGLLWFPVAYVSRFAFYLLIEPQINPVKHFPVVTVSHKVILPMFPTVAEVLHVSKETAIGILGCVPGVFGFIAWELMANWQLYRANRPARLKPAVIGSHGETVRGLLRPGFHSGTVPRLYRQLRKAERYGKANKAIHCHHELEHVSEGVRRFVERDLLALLAGDPEWRGVTVSLAAVKLGCQRITIELVSPGLTPGTFSFHLENRDGRIEASVNCDVRVENLSSAQRAASIAALRGLCDMSAAELFNGQPREPAGGPFNSDNTFSDLARPWTWQQWEKRWET